MPKINTLITFLFLSILSIHAQEAISIVDASALTVHGRFSNAINGRTYQKDMLITHKGYQYIAYYDGDRRVCLSRRKLPQGAWETLRFTDYHFASNDAHNVVSMGICPNDGTIHIAFDHHVHPLHYKVSVKGMASDPEQAKWDISSFGAIKNELEEGKPIKITYPKFWATPDGNLQMNYRVRGSGNGDRILVDYDATTGKWKNTRQIDSALGEFKDSMGTSLTRCSYPNGYDYDKNGTLHVTWVWREDSQGANHDLIYVYSEDRGFTWKNNAGETLTDIPNVNSPGSVVWDIPRPLGLMNDHGQVIDNQGRVHVVMYHCTEEAILASGSYLGEHRWGVEQAKRYHHYWRGLDGEWHCTVMDFKVGNRPKVLVDDADNLYMIYMGDPKAKHTESGRREDLIVVCATAANEWKDWHIKKVVEGPFMNDALADVARWTTEGVLSVVVQDAAQKKNQSTALKVIDVDLK